MHEIRKRSLWNDFSYRCMVWTFNISDMFSDPLRHFDRVPVKNGMIVVDYGCGTGRFTIPLAQAVNENGIVYAADIQPLALEIVTQKAIRSSIGNIRTVLVDKYSTGLTPDSIDLVFMRDTYHAIGDKPALLSEFHNILKPNGIVFMDPGHMKPTEALRSIEESGLFALQNTIENDILLTPL